MIREEEENSVNNEDIEGDIILDEGSSNGTTSDPEELENSTQNIKKWETVKKAEDIILKSLLFWIMLILTSITSLATFWKDLHPIVLVVENLLMIEILLKSFKYLQKKKEKILMFSSTEALLIVIVAVIGVALEFLKFFIVLTIVIICLIISWTLFSLEILVFLVMLFAVATIFHLVMFIWKLILELQKVLLVVIVSFAILVTIAFIFFPFIFSEPFLPIMIFVILTLVIGLFIFVINFFILNHRNKITQKIIKENNQLWKKLLKSGKNILKLERRIEKNLGNNWLTTEKNLLHNLGNNWLKSEKNVNNYLLIFLLMSKGILNLFFLTLGEMIKEFGILLSFFLILTDEKGLKSVRISETDEF